VSLSVDWLYRLFNNPDEANAPMTDKAPYTAKY
jgi:hypothetical protein